MKTILLITSILAFHYPAGLVRDTQRRYDNMRKHGKNFNYDMENGTSVLDDKPIFNFPFAMLSLLIGSIVPIFSLMELDISWYVAIIINILLYLFLGPFLAFISTPHMMIHNKKSFRKKAITFLFIGIITFILAIFIL